MPKYWLEVSQDQGTVYVHYFDDPLKVNRLIFHAPALWSLDWNTLNSPGTLESWLDRSALSLAWEGRGVQMETRDRAGSSAHVRSS